MKILFVMELRLNAGSIQAVSSYISTGHDLGYDFAVYGTKINGFESIKFATDVDSFDHIIFIFESNLYWIKKLPLAHILSEAPRNRRVILDADGMYNPIICINGYDCNHENEKNQKEWIDYYDSITDKIIQPAIVPSQNPNVVSIPFYGYDPQNRYKNNTTKKYDLMYVGHNWWRWDVMQNIVLPAIKDNIDILNDICFIGHWWDKPPPWVKECDFEDPFRLDHNQFKNLGIKTKPAIPYNQVIETMDHGHINIMTQRPLLRNLKHMTSKYFEVFLADTIPLVILDPDHSELVYGSAGRDLSLHSSTSDKLKDVIQNKKKYNKIVDKARDHISKHHSYNQRVQELEKVLIS